MSDKCFMDTPMNEGMPSRVSDTMVGGVLAREESSTGRGGLDMEAISGFDTMMDGGDECRPNGGG